jgi:sugar fermentation stimulation protein A
MAPLLTFDGALVSGTVVDRPNRFVVRVRFGEDDGAEPERAFLGDPGALEGIVEPGAEVLCSAADDPERATDHDAVAVRGGETYVSVRAALANDLFEATLARDEMPAFAGYSVLAREPALPEHGRTDFSLETRAGESAYAEVKSATYVEGGVAKFPDRQTERGRRHLRSLASLVAGGTEAHVAFVVQRPDVSALRPYREVDPEFADLLSRVREAGVGVHAIATAFDPPDYRLVDPDLPVEID